MAKEFTMHRNQWGDGEFTSPNHSGMLQQIIKLLGFQVHTEQNEAYGIKWESFLVDYKDVYLLCDKLTMLGWKYSD